MGDPHSGGDEGVCNTLRFRCLFFTRSAVALVVTVLAAIVVVKAAGVILHPNKLQLTVSPSNVYVQRSYTQYMYRFYFYLEAKNPSERDFIYYTNITVILKQGDTLMANFSLTPSSVSLSQEEEQEYIVYGSADQEHANKSLLDEALFKDESPTGKKIEGAVMTLRGIIRENAEEEGANAITSINRHVTYDCGSVVVSRELPRPSSDSHRGKCGRAILQY